MKTYILLILLFVPLIKQFAQNDQKELLIRTDDIGMCHSINLALIKMIEAEIPFSVSVMFACPWYQEAVQILKNHPEVSVGVHLTLNSEWKNYKWGPVLGKEAVPSLVDSNGYFFPSRATFNANNPDVVEIEKELRAQIDRAVTSGIRIDYLDYHMGAAVEKPEYRQIVEKLADEYKLGISQYLDEYYSNNMYNDPYEKKSDSLYYILNNLKGDRVNLLVAHIGVDTPELSSLVDLNANGLQDMSKHREAELDALTSPKLKHAIQQNNIKLINYRSLIDRVGLRNQKRPQVQK